MSSNILSAGSCTIPSLGRPFQLGALYDLPNEKNSALKLWNATTLQATKTRSNNFGCSFTVDSENTTADRLNSLQIEGDASLSVLAKLVTCGGAAKFLMKKKASQNEARVTMRYHVKTYFDQLSMDQLATPEYPTCLKLDATHVVTGIEYGADAFFIFEKELDKTENRYDAEGKMKLQVECLPQLAVKGEIGVDYNHEALKSIEKFRCTYYGDILPNENPSSHIEAMKLYQRLLSNLGDDQQRAVPKVIHLTPLTTITKIAKGPEASVSQRVSNHAAYQVHNLLDSYEALQEKIDKVMLKAEKELPDKFGNISNDLRRFKEIALQAKENFFIHLADVLPRIRKGDHSEEELTQAIDVLNRSHLSENSNSLNSWLKLKENEIDFLKQFLAQIPNESVQYAFGFTFNQMVMDPGYSSPIIILSFCLSRQDPLLDLFSDSVNSKTFLTTLKESCSSSLKAGIKWMKDEKLQLKLRYNVTQFSNLVCANMREDVRFIVTDGLEIENEESTRGSELMLYIHHQNGTMTKQGLHTCMFEELESPVPVEESITHDSVEVRLPGVGSFESSGAVIRREFKLCYKIAQSSDPWKTANATIHTNNPVLVRNLKQNTTYEFTVVPSFGYFVGKESRISDPIRTKVKRRRSTLRMPGNPEASTLTDIRRYRSGYPGSRDDPKINHNFEFFINQRKAEPNGDFIEIIHRTWWGNYQLLESNDYYIQWLFPIKEQGSNAKAKVLQDHEIKRIRTDPKADMPNRLIKSYEMMLDFYGLRLANRETGEVAHSHNWKERFKNLNIPNSKNALRITRILKCLGEFGLEYLQAPLVKFLLDEVIFKGTLESCLVSCVHYWIEVVKNDEQRKEIHQIARNALI